MIDAPQISQEAFDLRDKLVDMGESRKVQKDMHRHYLNIFKDCNKDSLKGMSPGAVACLYLSFRITTPV